MEQSSTRAGYAAYRRTGGPGVGSDRHDGIGFRCANENGTRRCRDREVFGGR